MKYGEHRNFSKLILLQTSTSSYLPHLHQVGDHDDHPDLLLPDHPPEGVKGVWQRTLGADVGPRLLEAIDVVGVDIFALLLSRERAKLHPRVIN